MSVVEIKPSIEVFLKVACDLTRNLTSKERHARLLESLAQLIPCDASALLQLRGDTLYPIAISGLSPDTMGREFKLEDHPRLQAIMASRSPTLFLPDDPRPDPYDGLVEWEDEDNTPIHLHSCMGCPLFVEDDLVGVLTVDALQANRFQSHDLRLVEAFAALAATAIHTSTLIGALKEASERNGLVAQHLVTEALQRDGRGLQPHDADHRRNGDG